MTTQAERNAQMLSTEHLSHNLGQHTARSGIITVAAQPIRTLLQFVTSAIMARLLAPEDFGLVAMAMVVTGFVSIFTDLGLSAATVQKKEIDQDTVSGLFYIGLGIGLLLVPLAAAAAPLAAMFFKDPRVTGLIIALAISMPLAAAGAQHTALLMRSMRWMTIQWTAIVGHAVGALAGILVAWKTDLGYWALVVTPWVAGALTLALTWIVCPWRPTNVRDWTGARNALGFGLNVTGFSVVNFFNRQLDSVIIGWRAGAAELGYYARAYALLLLPINMINGPVSSALMPSLSRLQNEPARWRRAFLDALGLTAFLGSGLAAVLIAVAEPLVTILYGEGWSKSAVIFRYLAISIFASTPINATNWIYISLGRTRRMLIWSLLFTPFMAGAFLLAMSKGSIGIAIAYAIVMNLALVPAYAFATHRSPVRLWETMKTILPMSAVGAIAATVGALLPLAGSPAFVHLFIAASVTGLIYCVLAGGLIVKAATYRDVRERLLHLAGAFVAKVSDWRRARAAS